jgi:hypothetical protein
MDRSSSPGKISGFLLFTLSRPVPGPTQPVTQWVAGGESSMEIKRQRREADHSPPISVGVKYIWIHTSTPHTH